MSWFGNNNLKSARQRQIKSLEQVPNIRCMEPQKEWRITVSTRLGDRSLYISLPENFPGIPPRLRIDSNLQHSFADESGNIQNMSELKYWTQTSDVGRLVNSIISNFQNNPPVVKPNYGQNPNSSSSSLSNMKPNYGMGNMSNDQMISPSPSFHQQEQTIDLENITLSPPKDIWEIPSTKKLTETAMKNMLDDESELQDFTMEAAAGIREMKTAAHDGLIATAKSNLKKKEEIATVETEIKKLRSDVDQLTKKFFGLKEQQQKLIQTYAPPRLLQEFENALSKIDEQCDQIRQKFKDKELTEPQFMKAYTELRLLFHLLGAKKEKFASLYT